MNLFAAPEEEGEEEEEEEEEGEEDEGEEEDMLYSTFINNLIKIYILHI